jgi:protein-tyrosine kinase
MSHISKALEKYKKERKLTSAQIFNLDDAKSVESGLKTGESQAIPANVHAESAEPSTQPKPLNIEPSAAEPMEAAQRATEPLRRNANGRKPKRKVRIVSADKRPSKTELPKVKNKDKRQPDKDEKAESVALAPKTVTATISESEATIINLDRVGPNLVSVLAPHSLETEIFKVLRSKILFPTSGKPPRSIMVTSAVPGEGKSFVAANLAVNMAQNLDDHVLLMDCDLRRPTMHGLFGLGKVKGVSDYLANGADLPELLIKTGLGKLSLFPSGKTPHNPSEILSSAKMAELLGELKSRYKDRYLIIEAPPPMLAPETNAIAKQVDAIIVVINFGSTPMGTVEELIDNLGKEKIIGAVVNRFDTRSSSTYYGYHKYGKYYSS